MAGPDDDASGLAVSGPAVKKRARVALVRPNVVIFPQSLSWYGPVPPIGIAYVAAVIRQAGHQVDVIDSVGDAIESQYDFETPVGTLRRIGLTNADILDRIDPDTDVIGITHMFLHEWPTIRELAEQARERFPNAVIVAGGENATAFWPWMFEQTEAIDYCVLGEGEATFLELVNRVAEGRAIDGMSGIAASRAHGTDGEACDTGLSIRTRKLDTVPRPAWDLFPMEEYWRYADFYGVHRGRSMLVLATRGCPYKCSFCSSPQMWTTRYVVRDPDDVADEIADYVHDFGVKNVNFADLTAITKRKWTLQFCDALDKRVSGITWQLPVGTRAEALDAEVLQRLWDTGCRNITYAPEAGGERMLKIYDKKVKLPHILTSLKEAKRIGIITRVNIIIGHPEERWGDVWKSLGFLVKSALAGCDDSAVMIFGPYPGSADFQRLVDSGRLVVDETFHYVGLARVSSSAESYNERMSTRQLRIAQFAMLVTFYAVGFARHPSRFARWIRGMFGENETTAVDQLIRVKRKAFRRLDSEAA